MAVADGMTPARADLPTVGTTIAALHGGGRWYFGPLEVIDVVDSPRRVEVQPLYWPKGRTMVFTPDAEDPQPLRWNLVADLSDSEREELHEPLP